MIVISLSTVPAKLRGYLSLYLWEIDTNVYVGNVSAKVRDLLWTRIEELVVGRGRAIMVFPSSSEQGFDFKTCGTSFQVVDFEGLKLVKRPTEKMLAATMIPREIKKISRKSYKDSYVVLDLETTGLDVEKDRIIEVGAVKVINGRVSDTFDCVIKSDIEISDKIIQITGIEQNEVENGRPFRDVLSELRMFIGNSCVIGYNISGYDARILHFECMRNKVEYPFVRFIDVLPLARQAIPGLPSYTLSNVAAALNITQDTPHRALADSMACHEIYQKIFEKKCKL